MKNLTIKTILGLSIILNIFLGMNAYEGHKAIEEMNKLHAEQTQVNIELQNKIDKLEEEVKKVVEIEVIKEETKSTAKVEPKVETKVVEVVKVEKPQQVIVEEKEEEIVVKQEVIVEEQEETIEENKYTEEDYARYQEYKQGLIDEYGEEVYNLMNQEAGIENEQQSFEHYMKYGI